MHCHVECRYGECRYANCRFAECRYTEYRYAECRFTEYHYAECRYAECLGTLVVASSGALLVKQLNTDPKFKVSNPGTFTIKLFTAVIYGFP
jgi:hypothetical protein